MSGRNAQMNGRTRTRTSARGYAWAALLSLAALTFGADIGGGLAWRDARRGLRRSCAGAPC